MVTMDGIPVAGIPRGISWLKPWYRSSPSFLMSRVEHLLRQRLLSMPVKYGGGSISERDAPDALKRLPGLGLNR